jgi:hypothetical protein
MGLYIYTVGACLFLRIRSRYVSKRIKTVPNHKNQFGDRYRPYSKFMSIKTIQNFVNIQFSFNYSDGLIFSIIILRNITKNFI